MTPIKVGLVLYPGCIPSGLFATAELLHAANQLAGARRFEAHWVGTEDTLKNGIGTKEKVSLAPLSIRPDKRLCDLSLEELLIPGMWIESMEDLNRILESNEDLVNFLKSYPPDFGINAYCSSVSFLALSGRLDQQKATSTWWLANFYSEKFPKTQWNFNHSFMEGANFTCASGVNGYLPIAMHLIEKHLGQKVLREVTKVMLLPRPEALQSPFQKVDRLSLNDPMMRKILLWVEDTPASDLNTEALSVAMKVPERTLARRIKTQVGDSTMNFMRLIKLNQASEALILTDASVSEICEKIGYEDDRTFRRSFKRATNYTPGDYRTTFKRPDFDL